MLTTGRPARSPANTTTPGPADRTGVPSLALRSTPRCPGSHRRAGGSKARTTVMGPAIGGRHTVKEEEVEVGAASCVGAASTWLDVVAVIEVANRVTSRVHRRSRRTGFRDVMVAEPDPGRALEPGLQNRLGNAQRPAPLGKPLPDYAVSWFHAFCVRYIAYSTPPCGVTLGPRPASVRCLSSTRAGINRCQRQPIGGRVFGVPL